MTNNETTCQMCGVTQEGGNAWGGWCHDCDNYYEAVIAEQLDA